MMLSNKNIASFLGSHGFKENSMVSSFIRFEHPIIRAVYVDMSLVEQSLTTYPLIVDFKWSSKEPSLFQRAGIFEGKRRHSDSLGDLSKDRDRKGRFTHTGFAIGFSSIEAL